MSLPSSVAFWRELRPATPRAHGWRVGGGLEGIGRYAGMFEGRETLRGLL